MRLISSTLQWYLIHWIDFGIFLTWRYPLTTHTSTAPVLTYWILTNHLYWQLLFILKKDNLFMPRFIWLPWLLALYMLPNVKNHEHIQATLSINLIPAMDCTHKWDVESRPNPWSNGNCFHFTSIAPLSLNQSLPSQFLFAHNWLMRRKSLNQWNLSIKCMWFETVTLESLLGSNLVMVTGKVGFYLHYTSIYAALRWSKADLSKCMHRPQIRHYYTTTSKLSHALTASACLHFYHCRWPQ